MMVMTTNTIKGAAPEANALAAIEPPSADKAQPTPATPGASAEPDLASRIQLRREELIRKLREIRADTRLATAEGRDRLKASLSELARIIKTGVVDGWSSLGESVKHKLESWLTEAERAVAALDQATKHGHS